MPATPGTEMCKDVTGCPGILNIVCMIAGASSSLMLRRVSRGMHYAIQRDCARMTWGRFVAIFMCGSIRATGGPKDRNVLQYDAFTGEWRSLPPLPEAHAGLAAAAHESIIYMLGGSTEQ